MGSTREFAEKSALGNLVAIFGQSVQVDEKVTESYQQAVKNGKIASSSGNTAVDNTIATSASLDSLIGAEIGETWFDGKNEYYAAAVMNKAKAALVYTEIVKSNQAIIDNLIAIPEVERNTFDALTSYQVAALIADMMIPYGNLLSVIGAPVQGLKSGTDYRLEASNIAKAIPVGIRVQNDKSGRVQGAFAKAFSGLGFPSGGSSSPYLLDVDIITTPLEIANNPNKWTRIEVSANLRDSRLNTVLLPYNFNSREGHVSQAEADNRAYMAAERIINENYAKLMSDYLSGLIQIR
jgi:hypothetical protein